MSATGEPALLADIGGTNARLALAVAGRIRSLETLAVGEFSGPADAIRAFLARTRPEAAPSVAILALAGPVDGGRGHLINGAWRFDAATLAGELGIPRVILVNDFAVLARGLPELTAADLHRVGGGDAVAEAPRVVLGPGTGLGVAAFVPVGGGIVLETEGGHATLSAEDGREAEILSVLRDRHGHVSAERVLSGSGLELLYEALRGIDGFGGPAHRTAEAITKRALAGDCRASRAVLDTFCAMLGAFAGNVALMIGARGGVYVAGGIVPRFPEFLARSEFRPRFEAKGRFRQWLSAIPAYVVTRPNPAFAGLLAMIGSLD